MLIILKHFYQKTREGNFYTIFCPKMFQYPHIVYYQRTLLQSLGEDRFYFFFSSSDTKKIHHLLGCHASGINSSFNSFFSALRFSNLICLTKKAVLTREKIKTNGLTKAFLTS